MSKHKMIFFGIVAGVIIVIALIFSYLGNMSSGTTNKGPKEFNVWVVGDETAGFSSIITGFKKSFPEYSGTQIKFTKFSSYSDYEKILLNVMTDGNSPDVFVVNNSTMTAEADGVLEAKTVGIPSTYIDTSYFEKNFNKVFDELIAQVEQKNADGKLIKVDYLKGVPMGYETLGIFYNFKKIRNVGSTWSELDKEIENKSEEDYSTIGIGLGGRYVMSATDILSLLFVQNDIDSYKKLEQDNASNFVKAYKSYYRDENNKFYTFKEDMDSLGTTATDLFVKGKIGMLIGYPSLIKEIILSIKRSEGSAQVGENTLRSAPVFQFESNGNSENKKEKVDLVNYNYFALSKYSKYQDFGMKFLSYLASKDAQEKYLSNFPYYLPSMIALEEGRLDQPLETGYDRAKYRDFISNSVTLKSFSKGLRSEYDRYFSDALSESGASDVDVTRKGYKLINCNVNHIIKGVDFEKQCD